jgi:hypothetical protein
MLEPKMAFAMEKASPAVPSAQQGKPTRSESHRSIDLFAKQVRMTISYDTDDVGSDFAPASLVDAARVAFAGSVSRIWCLSSSMTPDHSPALNNFDALCGLIDNPVKGLTILQRSVWFRLVTTASPPRDHAPPMPRKCLTPL